MTFVLILIIQLQGGSPSIATIDNIKSLNACTRMRDIWKGEMIPAEKVTITS
jgi:hypothetical protein